MAFQQNQYGELTDETVSSAVNLKLVEPDIWATFCNFQEALEHGYKQEYGSVRPEDYDHISLLAAQLTTAASTLAAAPNK